jgi:hypothetical protein
MPWRLRSYVDVRGQSVIGKWYDSLSASDAAKVQIRTWYLLNQPHANCTRPYFDSLHGTVSGFGEIILGKVGGVQTRLVGYFDCEPSSFTVVCVVTKKQRKYSPHDWQKVSIRRRKDIECDSWKAHEWIPQEPLG